MNEEFKQTAQAVLKHKFIYPILGIAAVMGFASTIKSSTGVGLSALGCLAYLYLMFTFYFDMHEKMANPKVSKKEFLINIVLHGLKILLLAGLAALAYFFLIGLILSVISSVISSTGILFAIVYIILVSPLFILVYTYNIMSFSYILIVPTHRLSITKSFELFSLYPRVFIKAAIPVLVAMIVTTFFEKIGFAPLAYAAIIMKPITTLLGLTVMLQIAKTIQKENLLEKLKSNAGS